MSKISAQPSIDLATQTISEVEDPPLSRTPSESTFTRHTRSINSIIKEVLLGILCILQFYLTYKLSK